ncbi:trypsin-like serine protease [Streptomyces sp. NBC_01142]|uniref:trypsin-like serine protease n=1 Tax=Streptomyces sp. NBC_01142 TaxID=2975865 RepID=UPI002254CB78|nr:trypsin-like serine protease [Streptomyces sp. NBC_01142]MCX4823292.1 trypsin-like serine protease [Streptomyces sp. NBC_01142]
MAPTAPSAPAPPPPPTLTEEEKFWTAERMAEAVPVDSARGEGPSKASKASRAPARSGLRAADAPPGTKKGEYFGGLPMVGTFFHDGTPFGGKSTSCTGSVVRSGNKDLVLTAAHCANGLKGATHRIFVPQYRHGSSTADQPSGVFPVNRVFIDPRYKQNTKEPVSDLDFAFARVAPNSKGKAEDVTGALTFTRSAGYRHNATVIGYPHSEEVNKKHQALRCDVATSRLHGFRQMQMTCGGFYGGVSGGPWITDYDAATRTGKIIGNTGGYNGGGNDQNVDWISYSPLYAQDAQLLYDDAVAGTKDADIKRPPYVPTTDSPYLPGSGDLWTHAKVMTSGDFSGTGHSDLIVIWTDGEVSLYPGNGKGGFHAERRLLAKNSLWGAHAATVTGGDFTGSNQFDLLVRWSDGEVTLYPDVSAKGLGHAGTQMAKKDSVWKHATQISAGRFNAATYVTDLMVRWKDGELSLYTNVSSGTFGQEHKLRAADPLWEHATLLTSGQFSGNHKWDLMIRWSDGEVDNYVGTTTAGLGVEKRVLNANDLWGKHASVISAGNYTANGLADDLLVRWSDGETTMYTDSRSDRLGAEVMLVAP